MTRRTRITPGGRFQLARDRMAPGGRLWVESPVSRRWDTAAGIESEEPEPPVFGPNDCICAEGTVSGDYIWCNDDGSDFGPIATTVTAVTVGAVLDPRLRLINAAGDLVMTINKAGSFGAGSTLNYTLLVNNGLEWSCIMLLDFMTGYTPAEVSSFTWS